MRRLFPPLALLICLLAFASTASAGGRLYMPLYGADPEAVAGFDRNADGSLTPLAGSPFALHPEAATPSGVFGIGFTPDGGRAAASFLFNGGIAGYSVSAGGAIAPAGAPLATASMTGIAVSPDGRFAYAPTREFKSPAEGIRAFTIGADGSLAPLGAPYGSGQYWDIAITPDGRFLYSIGGGGIDRFAVNADGSLTPLGLTPLSSVSQLLADPRGRFLIVSIEGVGALTLTIGPDGGLTPNGEALVTGGGASIPYIGVAPDGSRIYIPDGNVDKIVAAAVNADGTLAALGSLPAEQPGAAAVTPDGNLLYWFDDAGDTLQVAAIGPDGVPTPLPFTAAVDSGEHERIVFQPQPAPLASFTAKAAEPGAASRFNAAGSERAARYEWNFGDGTVLTDGGPNPRHAYAGTGVYEARLTVFDASGCSVAQVYTGQSTTCPGGAGATSTVAIDTPAGISRLKATPKKFAAAGRGKGAKSSKRLGTHFRYRLSERATVRFKIERRLPGRKLGKKCVRKTAKNAKRKPCPRFRKLGSRTAKGKGGANRTYFSGRLRGAALPPGSYRVTAVATDAAGGRSIPRRTAFSILGRG